MQELDTKISEAQAPMDALEHEHEQAMLELDAQIREGQRSLQDLNMNIDKLDNLSKVVERYAISPVSQCRTQHRHVSDIFVTSEHVSLPSALTR